MIFSYLAQTVEQNERNSTLQKEQKSIHYRISSETWKIMLLSKMCLSNNSRNLIRFDSNSEDQFANFFLKKISSKLVIELKRIFTMTTTRLWRRRKNRWNEIDNFLVILIIWFVICEIFVINVIIFLLLILLFVKVFLKLKLILLVDNVCSDFVNTIIESFFACLRIRFRSRLIFRIWFAFENQLQRLFDEWQNDCNWNRLFDEELILIFLILISWILELIRSIIKWKSFFVLLWIRIRKLKIVDVRLLLIIILSFSILLTRSISSINIVVEINVRVVKITLTNDHIQSDTFFSVQLNQKAE